MIKKYGKEAFRMLSINGLKLAQVPPGFERYQGKCAFDLFCAQTVKKMVLKQAKTLALPAGIQEPSKQLAPCLHSQKEEVRTAAEHIIAELGTRLGIIFYTLKTASPEIRQAHPWAAEEDWRPYTQCETLWLAGGLASGELGRRLAERANTVVNSLENPGICLKASPHAGEVPLLGCARMGEGERIPVFDLGQSFLKSGIAFRKEGEVTALRLFPKEPARYAGRNYMLPLLRNRDCVRLHAYLLDYLAEGLRRFGDSPPEQVVCSMAAIVKEGELEPLGGYGKLERRFPGYRKRLETELGQRLGNPIRLHLTDDNQAAAACFAGTERTIVVTLGTAFGVGCPPPAEGLVPLAEGLIPLAEKAVVCPAQRDGQTGDSFLLKR